MSAFVAAVDSFGQTRPDTVAFANSRGETITYGRLKCVSDALARHLAQLDPEKRPVVVYGHKSPLMIACFQACSKSGRAYVPIDVVYPDLRVIDILDQLGNPIVLNTTDRDLSAFAGHMGECVSYAQLLAVEDNAPAVDVAPVSGLDTFYILFTSGSTGRPKGVEIMAECVDNFWRWMIDEFGEAGHTAETPRVLFNRAPFSFDLSMTDIGLGLGAGDTMFALVEEDEENLTRTFAALQKSGIDFWCSTASFAEMCLRDPSFSRDLLPHVNTFFFVGETLKNETAAKLMERFDGCKVINGYGPTESTDLVTSVVITPEMCASPDPLPVGLPMPGCELYVLDPETLAPVPAGQSGELFIVGNTVAKGYFGRDDLTQAAFHSCPPEIANGQRSYRTGDGAILGEDGMLHFRGRLDFQVKLHGFRIELGEIESTLRKIAGVDDACVLPVERRGSISHLAACVAGAGLSQGDTFARAQDMKDTLRESLPEYMVPRKIAFLEELPLNVNGKVDRKKLRELV